MKSKKERINELSELIIKTVPISEVIKSRIDTVNDKALCPFHDDKKIGSFHFNDSRGIYKCFSCDAGGNAIRFIKNFDSITYSEAVCLIAAEFKLITKEEYNDLTSKTFEKTRKEFKPLIHSEQTTSLVKDDDELDLVYSIMSKGESLINNSLSVLSKEHYSILKNDRKLTDEQIEKRGYFTFPKDKRKFLSAIKNELRQRDLKPNDVLLGIPGFYWDKKTNKIDMSKVNGLVIPIKNCYEQIIGLQIRKDVVKGDNESRYVWYSSQFTNDQKFIETLSHGCSPIKEFVPVDVVFPEEFKRNSVLITEGHFKAQLFTNKYNCTSLSVQGVGNYQEVPRVLTELELLCPQGTVDNICIAYDADMSVNKHVIAHSINLGKLLKSNLKKNVYYYIWDMNVGKGIDDYLINAETINIKRFEFSDYAWKTSEFIQYLENPERDSSTKLSEEDKYKKFKEIFDI